jgi:hypothetical protein
MKDSLLPLHPEALPRLPCRGKPMDRRVRNA